MSYKAPLADMRFALEHAAGFWSLRDHGYADLDADLLSAILEGAARLAEDVLAPLNRIGDREGVSLANDAVRTPAGFKAAYRAFAAGGWQGLSASPAYGGQGLPRAAALCVYEMIHAANMAFGLAPMLTLAAIEALEAHGSAEQKSVYLPKMVSGEWAGAMNLTEPQAGSDLGALKTKAAYAADGSYRLTGQKIFITWGEHDLSDNIIHLVLARLPDAPEGSRGISLFLAPKVLPDGTRNRLRCIGLEEKLGIHASPTCTMAYEGAAAWLVGEENKGLAHMFTMMNAARLNVGLQGVAIAEAAYQRAHAFARERRQGRAEGAREEGPSPIIQHPDIARTLAFMKAKTMAARAICYATAVALDRGDEARAGLLTPIAKAWPTDWGVEAASLGLQIHGGMGFIEETGAAQLYRDARIAPIYEGANGIQAIDLVRRKVQADGGAEMRNLLMEARAIAVHAKDGQRTGLARAGERLMIACAALEEATAFVLSHVDQRDILAGAGAYLNLVGDVVGGALFARAVAHSGDSAQEAGLLVYSEYVLARAPAALPAIRLGASAPEAVLDADA